MNELDNVDRNRDDREISMRSSGDEDETGETENIREQIEETRNQMGDTIDAIQDRLSFSNISEQVSGHVQSAVETGKEAIYDATIGKAKSFMKNAADNISGSAVVKTVKENPLPFVLIGAGAGLLAYKAYTKPSYQDSWRYRSGARQDFESASSTTGTSSGQISALADKASETAGNAVDKVTGAVQEGYTRAGDMVNQAYGKASEFKDVAADQYRSYLNENPLALGAVALGLGAVLGLAIPASRYEGELLGETRNELLDKAQNAASGLLDKTKRAITDADVPMVTHKGSTAAH